MATATAMVTARMAGMATTASPRTATTAIPPTATTLMVMAIGATAMATAAAIGNGRISPLPSLTPGSRGRRRGWGDRALGDGSPKGGDALAANPSTLAKMDNSIVTTRGNL